MSKKKVEEKKDLHIGANPKRVRAEQIAEGVKQAKDVPKPQTVTLNMLYERQAQILEQNAYIIEKLSK